MNEQTEDEQIEDIQIKDKQTEKLILIIPALLFSYCIIRIVMYIIFKQYILC